MKTSLGFSHSGWKETGHGEPGTATSTEADLPHRLHPPSHEAPGAQLATPWQDSIATRHGALFLPVGKPEATQAQATSSQEVSWVTLTPRCLLAHLPWAPTISLMGLFFFSYLLLIK